MREIKFRGRYYREKNALYAKEDRWVYGSLIVNGDMCWIRDGNTTYSVIPKTVGQYTGLKDKNAYEGDVVNVKRYDKWYRGQIQWSDSISGWIIKCHWASHPKSDYYSIRPEEISDLEIIGNIYENPELGDK